MFPFWDTVLHTLNGFLAAAIGFSLVDLLNRSERTSFTLSPVFMAIVAFCFSMTIGVIWEFFEFGMDQILGYDMQKDTVIHVIRSVTLDPAGHNVPAIIEMCIRDRFMEQDTSGQRRKKDESVGNYSSSFGQCAFHYRRNMAVYAAPVYSFYRGSLFQY